MIKSKTTVTARKCKACSNLIPTCTTVPGSQCSMLYKIAYGVYIVYPFTSDNAIYMYGPSAQR